MSSKRAATSELNHENWDQDDPSEHEEMGTFKAASKDILEKRIIRTAKRRSQISSEDGNKGVFKAFGGFNKAPTSSFDFLANLTNGNKNNVSPNKSETTVTSSLFSNNPLSSSPSGPIFGTVTSTASGTTFGIPTQSSSIFGVSSTNTQTTTSIFTATKADSTVGDSPFKSQPISSTTEVSKLDACKTTNVTSNAIPSPVTSTLFGVSTTNASASKSLFSMTTSTPFKIQPVSSSTMALNSFGTTSTTIPKPSVTDNNTSNVNDDKKLKYYAKLKGLNESVSDWIKKHVEETPLCILTPIFKDYEKYLKEMQEEYQGGAKEPEKNNINNCLDADKKESTKCSSAFSNSIIMTSSKPEVLNPKASELVNQNSLPTLGDKPNFSFGITNNTSNIATTVGFSFGISTSPPTTTTTSLFSGISSVNSNGGTQFSFGIGKPFSFNSNIQKPVTEKTDNVNEETNEDEPPKVEYKPIVEENSVYDKKCKIFVKKDGNFVDKGVGTLYIKKIEETGKYQLLVRANTNLGNVLVNLILASAIPTQRMGKNNVMMICIPTPDAKPPPTSILIRVKTADEADELLKTLNEHKS
ncbi:unnamed protein product [Diatraea saccharalis]|uniref:RanBD1 domain-containing protein n=1 Tax=Diatraea saccharalis TaxID=40085 RepID=A0A9N9R920_9NEOP|nr:unnamed protein product [Diatraea saccharalis]